MEIIKNLFNKYHLGLNLLLLLCCGVTTGMLLMALLAARLDDVPREWRTAEPAVQSNVSKSTRQELRRLLERNLFALSGAVAVPGHVIEPGSGKPAAPGGKQLSLIGTVVAGMQSMAWILVDKELDLYRLGDRLAGGVVKEIDRNRVRYLADDGRFFDLELVEPVEQFSSPVRPGGRSDRDVTQIDENKWLISRQTIEETRENMVEQLKLAQVRPRMIDGRTEGIVIQSLRHGSILKKLGIKRGDVILSINDISLDRPETALQVFQQLREAREINALVERQGDISTFTYELN